LDGDAVNDFWCVIEGLVTMFAIALVFPFLQFLKVVVTSFIGIGPRELLYFVKHVMYWIIGRIIHYWPALVIFVLFVVMDVFITLGIGGRLRLLAKSFLLGLLTFNPIIAMILFAFFRGMIQTLEPFYEEKIRMRIMRRILQLEHRFASSRLSMSGRVRTLNKLKIIAVYTIFSLGIAILFYGVFSVIPVFVSWTPFVYSLICILATVFQRDIEIRKLLLSAIPPFGVTVYITY